MRILSLIPLFWVFFYVQFNGNDHDSAMFMMGALPASFAIIAYGPEF